MVIQHQKSDKRFFFLSCCPSGYRRGGCNPHSEVWKKMQLSDVDILDDMLVTQQFVISFQDALLCSCPLWGSGHPSWIILERKSRQHHCREVRFCVLDGQTSASVCAFISQGNRLTLCHCPSQLHGRAWSRRSGWAELCTFLLAHAVAERKVSNGVKRCSLLLLLFISASRDTHQELEHFGLCSSFL